MKSSGQAKYLKYPNLKAMKTFKQAYGHKIVPADMADAFHVAQTLMEPEDHKKFKSDWDKSIATGKLKNVPVKEASKYSFYDNKRSVNPESLKNPIIVAEISPGKHVVLDGNHRLIEHFKQGLTHVPVFHFKAPHLADLDAMESSLSEDYLKKSLRKLLPKDITNKEVARHWHKTAYPDEDSTKENQEYFQDMLADHHEGKWQKMDIPVDLTSGHHTGHDATKEDIEAYKKMHTSGGTKFPSIIVKPHPDKPGHYRTIDGQHRLEAAKQLGHTHISAYVPMRNLRSLKKMSQPRLQFPKLGTATRLDQDVRQIETDRQKQMFGKLAAQHLHPDTTTNLPVKNWNPATMEYETGAPVERKINRKTMREAYAKRIANRFGRNTLGTNISSTVKPTGKSYNAALAGAQRTKFERHEASDEAKTKHAAKQDAYAIKHKAWHDTATKLRADYHAANDTESRFVTRNLYNAHIKTKPRRPGKIRTSKKDTKQLPKDQQILRGKGIDSTIEHEGAHALIRQIEAKHGNKFAAKVKQHLLDAIPKDTRDKLVSFIASRGYKPSNQYFGEEVLTHARDILVNPTKRAAFEKHVGLDKARNHTTALKRAWKDIVNKAKKVDSKFLDQSQAEPLAASEQLGSDLEKMGLHGDWQKEGYKISHKIIDDIHGNKNYKNLMVEAWAPSGERAGRAIFSTPHADPKFGGEALDVGVHPDHERKGLATAIYQHAEKILQKPLKPSVERTPEGHAFWSQPARPFGKAEGDAKQYDVSFKSYQPEKAFSKAKGWAQYHFTKGDLKHIIDNFDTEGQWAEGGNMAQRTGEFHPTAITRNKVTSPIQRYLENTTDHSVGKKLLYHGVGKDDISAMALTRGGKHGVHKYDPYHANAETRKLPDGHFHEVHSHYTLNVVPPHIGKQILQEIHDRLDPEGKAVISVRRDLNPVKKAEDFRYEVDSTPESIAVYVYGQDDSYIDTATFAHDNGQLIATCLNKSEYGIEDTVRNIVQNYTGLKIK